MRASSQDVIDLLASRVFVQVDIYTFKDISGTTYRYAAGDIGIVLGGHTWSASGPLITRQRAVWKLGLDVSTLQMTVLPRPVDPAGNVEPDQILGQPWIVAARSGAFDGTEMLIERAYLPAWPQPWTPTVVPTGTVIVFGGRIAEVYPTRTGVVMDIKSHTELLDTKMPRNLFQAGCRFTLFGAGCGLTASSFAVSGTATSGTTNNAINASLMQSAGYFDLGRVVMTSGASNGFMRAVRRWDGSTLTLVSPFTLGVAAGDTFSVYPGCDKSLTTCDTKFSNKANYGGTPRIPSPETAV